MRFDSILRSHFDTIRYEPRPNSDSFKVSSTLAPRSRVHFLFYTHTHTHRDTLAHLHTAIKNNELLLMGNMLITNCGWNSLVVVIVVVVAFVTSFFSDLYFWLTFFWDLWRFVKLHVTIQTVVVSVAAVGKFVECGFYCCFWRWRWRNQRLFCCVCLRFVLCVIHKKKAQNGKNIFPWKSVRRWEKYV